MYIPYELGDLSEYKTELIDVEQRRKFADIYKQAKSEAKLKNCFYCGKECAGFCKSHTVPQFMLKNISENGNLYYWNSILKSLFQKETKGVADAGVFYIICNECDATLFRDYENPANYENIPSIKMLAEIELKNILKTISKRLLEKEIYTIIKNKYSENLVLNSIVDISLKNIKLDLQELYNSLRLTKRHILKPSETDYYISVYEELDYTVPVAFQGQIALLVDLEGNVINETFNLKAGYKIELVNVCIFPLKNKSLVILYTERKNRRYKRFFKQLRNKCRNEKLKIINYILFLYTEDFFISPSISINCLEELKEIYSKTNAGILIGEEMNSRQCFEIEKKKYSLKNIPQIPNLLSFEYKIKNTHTLQV